MLTRAVFFHRLDEIRYCSFKNQRYRKSGRLLVVAKMMGDQAVTILCWQTTCSRDRSRTQRPNA